MTPAGRMRRRLRWKHAECQVLPSQLSILSGVQVNNLIPELGLRTTTDWPHGVKSHADAISIPPALTLTLGFGTMGLSHLGVLNKRTDHEKRVGQIREV